MRFRDMGVQLQYDSNFAIYREDGVSEYGEADYLFVYFHSRCCVELEGKVISVTPPAAILFDIHSRQHYYAVDDSYKDDYIHFWFDESRSFIDEIHIPLDTVIPLPDNVIVPNLLRQMYEEFVSINEYKQQSLEYIFRLVMLKIAEMSERCRQAKVPDRYDKVFQNLRSAIYLDPAKPWHVSECSEKNGLSTPYFQKLYKSYFGNTFVQDVVKSRMEYAKHFLLISHYTVKEIAAMCGYNNETFFMKQFKKNMGMTPSQYRQKNDSRSKTERNK